jgi:hypothetical protein
MLILQAKQVKYCYVIHPQGNGKEVVQGVSYQGNLFMKVESYPLNELQKAIQKCRQQLDEEERILSLIVQRDQGFTIWCRDDNLQLAKKEDIKFDPKTINLKELIAAMRDTNGVEIKARRYKLVIYPRCFIGSEAVDWLSQYLKISRLEAVSVGQRLVSEKIIHHVVDEHNFEDGYFFYRFYEDEGKSIWTEKIFP